MNDPVSVGTYNLNPFRKGIEKGISLFTAVKNRENLLAEALPTWVNSPEIDEIIIVDWSSDKSLVPLIKKYQNGKIILAIVKEQEKWILSHAFNMAARLTSRDKLLKIDADVKIMPGFFEKHTLKKGIFFTGYWAIGRDENEKHLNGNAFFYRDDFFRVNGYNEYIKFYGWDDDDFFLRMEAAGIRRIHFKLDTLFHLEHENRTTYQKSTQYLKNISDTEKSNIQIIINRYISQNVERWSRNNRMLGFDLEIQDKQSLICRQAHKDQNLLPEEKIHVSEIRAILERLAQLGIPVAESVAGKLSRDELIAFFNLFLSKENIPHDNHLYTLITKFNETYLEDTKRNIKVIAKLKGLVQEHELVIKGKEIDLQLANNRLQDREKVVETKEGVISELNVLVALKDQAILEKDGIIQNGQKSIKERDKVIEEKKQELNEKEQLILQKELSILEQEQTIQDKEKTIQENELIIAEKDRIIQGNNSVIQENAQLIREKDRLILDTKNELVDREEKLSAASSRITEKEGIIEERNRVINAKEHVILHQDQVISEHERTILEDARILEERENELLSVQNQLSDVYCSYSWRFGHGFFSLIAKLMFWKKRKL